jgi:hypothetical protein
VESSHAGAIALLGKLEAAWPRSLSFQEIGPEIEEAGLTLDDEGTDLLMQLVAAKMIELHAWRAPVAACVSERPRASACSRQEALTRECAATLLHDNVALDDPIVRSLLLLLDGTRDRKAILNAMRAEFPALPQQGIEGGIGPGLRLFHRAGLLEP